jgi:hypothetical protein
MIEATSCGHRDETKGNKREKYKNSSFSDSLMVMLYQVVQINDNEPVP